VSHEVRSAAAIVTAVCLLVPSACDRSEPLPPPSPVPIGSPVDIPASVIPTIDPEATSGLTLGSATVTVTGAISASETYPTLGLPAVWALPPETFSITWDGGGERALSLSGTSFTSQQPTSAERVLTFSVRGPEGPISFRSDTGGCLLTITPALPDRMAGTFLCSTISGEGEDGASVTAAAQGSFSAE
jgi:hypothetical protein